MGTKWNVFTNNLDLVSDLDDLVVGPSSSTDNAVARFDGTTGVLIQDSGVIISDADAVTGVASLTLDIGASIDEFSTDGTLAGNSDTALPTEKAVKTYVDALPSAAMPEVVVGGLASSHQVNTTTAFPPVVYRDFGSIEILTRGFDATGPEYMQSIFRVPADIDTSGTVTFEIVGSAATAAASKNVKFTFDFVQVAADGLLTGAYGNAEIWDDQSISGTQDDQDIISNTETVSNLGWVAGREIYYRLYREAATTSNLSGDYDVIAFNIRIPRA